MSGITLTQEQTGVVLRMLNGQLLYGVNGKRFWLHDGVKSVPVRPAVFHRLIEAGYIEKETSDQRRVARLRVRGLPRKATVYRVPRDLKRSVEARCK